MSRNVKSHEPAALNPALAAGLAALDRIILGKPEAVRLALTCLLARGHLLIEDVPGVGKTTLAHALAQVLGLAWQRVQFTSDLLPADIIGVSVFDAASGSFSFRKGPMFTQLLLADEVNRASPKTQSALLEAMEERQVSVDVTTYRLPDPFFVVATQNPFEQLGTFRLPESQLDRFLMRISLGYPDAAHERALLAEGDRRDLLAGMHARAESRTACASCRPPRNACTCRAALLDYVQALIASTRQRTDILIGLSPRAGQGLVRAARAWAMLAGRDMVLPEDVQAVFAPVASHRLERAGVATARRSRRVHRRARARRAGSGLDRPCPPRRVSGSAAAPQGEAAPRASRAWARRRQGEDRLPVTHQHAPRLHPADARRARVRGAGVRHAARRTQLREQRRAADHVPARGLRTDRDAPHASQPGRAWRCATSPRVDAFAGEHGRLLRRRWRMPPTRARLGIECEADGRRARRASTCPPAARRAPISHCRSSAAAAWPSIASSCPRAFPFGLFRAWTYVHLEAGLLAWPVPRGRREPPPEAASGGNAPAVHRAGDEEWAGLREFRSGDSPRQVAWGAYARGRGLLVKTYQSPAAHHRTVRPRGGAGRRSRAAPRTAVGVDRRRACARRALRPARSARTDAAAGQRQRTSRALPERTRAVRQR